VKKILVANTATVLMLSCFTVSGTRNKAEAIAA